MMRSGSYTPIHFNAFMRGMLQSFELFLDEHGIGLVSSHAVLFSCGYRMPHQSL